MINIEDAYTLDETGAQVDKVTGLFTKDEGTTSGEKAFAQLNIGTAGSNRNLLDNAYFVGGGSQLGDGVFPINQRGLSNYGAGYTIDRWKLSSGGTLVFTNDGISIDGLFFQKKVIDFTVGETYTLSRQTTDGNVVSATGVVPSNEGWIIGDQTFGVYFRPSTKVCDIQIWGTYLLKAVKLEKGTVSTLANDAQPDYWQELDKCLYYFERITNNGSGPITIGAGFADGANALYAPVRIHRKRAGISTISTSGAIYAGQRSPNISVSSVTQYNSTPDGIITLLANAPSSFTSNEYYRLVLGAGAHIDFSAEP